MGFIDRESVFVDHCLDALLLVWKTVLYVFRIVGLRFRRIRGKTLRLIFEGGRVLVQQLLEFATVFKFSDLR